MRDRRVPLTASSCMNRKKAAVSAASPPLPDRPGPTETVITEFQPGRVTYIYLLIRRGVATLTMKQGHSDGSLRLSTR